MLLRLAALDSPPAGPWDRPSACACHAGKGWVTHAGGGVELVGGVVVVWMRGWAMPDGCSQETARLFGTSAAAQTLAPEGSGAELIPRRVMFKSAVAFYRLATLLLALFNCTPASAAIPPRTCGARIVYVVHRMPACCSSSSLQLFHCPSYREATYYSCRITTSKR